MKQRHKPVTQWVYTVPGQLNPSFDPDMSAKVKHKTGTLTLWLGTDGLPVAVVGSQVATGTYKGDKGSGSFKVSLSWQDNLQRVGQRLVIVHDRTQNSMVMSGKLRSNLVTQVQLAVAGAAKTTTVASTRQGSASSRRAGTARG
ncbi:MAG TPA: hypothetical protein VF269_06180 [Rhodanobacteraceae bacterium]